jgi:hypothetical protein
MHATEKKNIKNAHKSISQDTLLNSLDLLAVSVSKPLPFYPDFNPCNDLEQKIICKDSSGKNLYLENFKSQKTKKAKLDSIDKSSPPEIDTVALIDKAKDFLFSSKNNTSEIHIIDSINFDYIFTLYNTHKIYTCSSFFQSPKKTLVKLLTLQRVICLKILQECITKKQPTPFMEQNNPFKIFSDLAKDYSQIVALENWKTSSSSSTLTSHRYRIVVFVEMLLKTILKYDIFFSANVPHNYCYNRISPSMSTYLQNAIKSFPLGDFFRPMEKMFDAQRIGQDLQMFCCSELHYYAFALIQQMRNLDILNNQTTFKEYSSDKTIILREYDINQLQLYHLHALVFSLDKEAKKFSPPQPQISQRIFHKIKKTPVKKRELTIKKIDQHLSIFASGPYFCKSDINFILAAYNILQKTQDTDLQSMIGDSIHSLTGKLKIDAHPDLGDSLFNEDQMSQISAFFWFPPSAQAINYHKKALDAFLLSKKPTSINKDSLSLLDSSSKSLPTAITKVDSDDIH